MILFDFRYQDPWAEDTIVFPNFIEQTQARHVKISKQTSIAKRWIRCEPNCRKGTLSGLITPRNIYATSTVKTVKPIPLKMTLPPSRYFYPT
jgi:hypothetical protein